MMLQGFCQDIDKDSVYVDVIGRDTIIYTSIEKARGWALRMMERDSCYENSTYLQKKIDVLDSIRKGDSIQIDNLEIDIDLAEKQLESKDKQLSIKDKEIGVREEETKTAKNQRWIWGGVGVAIGIIVQSILSIL